VIGRLDVHDLKTQQIENQVLEIKRLVANVAVDGNRLDRAEQDIHDLRRGVGFIRDAGSPTVDREY